MSVSNGRPVRFGLCCLAALFLMAAAPWVLGGPVLNDPELWASDLAGWTNNAPNSIGTGDATVENPGSGGADGDGYLRITFSQQSGEPAYEEDTVFANGAGYTGSYQTNQLSLQFAFYAEDILSAPGGAVLYLHSAVRTSLWEYAFSVASLGVWTTNTIQFDYAAGGWAGGLGGGAAEFWSDLANIDWIGINLVRRMDTMEQSFGIDNWQYMADLFVIPEPGSMFMLAAAFLSCGLAFRKRFREIFQRHNS